MSYKEKILVLVEQITRAGNDPVGFAKENGRQTENQDGCRAFALGYIRETLKDIPVLLERMESETIALPEWRGVIGDGLANDGPAIQWAIDCGAKSVSLAATSMQRSIAAMIEGK